MPRICPQCGTANRDTARFCINCAAPVVSEILCPACRTPNPPAARFCLHCAAPLRGATPPTGMLLPNTVLSGRYIILRRVGGGGMGAVYQAADQRITGKLWAVKEMSDMSIADPADKQRAVEAFRQEAQLLATLDHGNLPKVSDFFTENGKHYLVMDFVRGETLEHVLNAANGFLPESLVLGWAGQLCDVLGYLHSRQPPIIFRDLKPANIMLDADGRIKLIDFGIARAFQPGKSKDTQAMGTPGYAAPEQYGTGQSGPPSDVYALGVTLHQLLTRYDPTLTPFALPPARNINPALSPGVAAAIARATQPDANARFPGMAQMKAALSGAQAIPSARPAAPTVSPSATAPAPVRTPVAPTAPTMPPRLAVSTPELQLEYFSRSEVFEIRNWGGGTLEGRIETDGDVAVSPSGPFRANKLDVLVEEAPGARMGGIIGYVIVRSNGGVQRIPVRK